MPAERILVVDDVPINLKVVSLTLRAEGYEIQTAEDGVHALEVLRAFRPDLVLADIQMPRMDGLEMTRTIRQDPNLRDLFIVALTAFAAKVNEQEALDAGFDAYLTKPVDVHTLRERVRGYLDRLKEVQMVR